MKYCLMIIAVALFGAFILSNQRADVANDVGECVEAKALSDGFAGSLSEAWDTYASQCY